VAIREENREMIPSFNMSPILVLVLGFCTCGLFQIYWNLKAAQVLNAVSGKESISPAIALLAGCCLPVNGYFFYLTGQELPAVGRLIGKEKELADKGTLLLLLGLFLPPIAAMIVQGHLNELSPE
jgi:Domain of unknown function (DUF4234)